MAQQAIADMGIPAMWHGMAFDKVAGAAATRRDVWWHCHSQEADTDVPHNRQNAVNNARKERMGFRFAIDVDYTIAGRKWVYGEDLGGWTFVSKEQKWPDVLWLVRHGESAGNVARDAAEASGQDVIQIAQRDADVPLSERGEHQARAVGEWFGTLPPEQRPTVILASPYLRARQTADLLAEAAGIDREELPPIIDERLREKEFGILDRLTYRGVAEKYPEQAELRRMLGKFYHRPPGGESWCDVILRLRSVVDTVTREWRAGERVLIVSHQVVVLCFRYLMERMTEEQLLAVDRDNQIANCSITSYEFDSALGKHGRMALRLFNFVAPIAQSGEEVTREADVPIGVK